MTPRGVHLSLVLSSKFAQRISGGGLALAIFAAGVALAAEAPDWAYPLNAPGAAAPATDETAPHHVPGSSAAFTAAQIAGRDGVPDWRPDEHPTMPPIVLRSALSDVNLA